MQWKMVNRVSSKSTISLGQRLFLFLVITVDVLKLLVQCVAIIAVSIFRCFAPEAKKSVRGQVVVITGSGHGLGRQLALNFASLGAKVVLLDVNEKNNLDVQKEILDKGGVAVAYECDVANEKQVEEVGEKIRAEVGDVYILINNAGILSGKPIMYLHSYQIRKTLEVNTLSHFWTIRYFLPAMLESGRGQIVAIASIAGLMGCANLTDYCSSKHAVVGLMSALREDLYAQGKEESIVLTVVCPSTINTGLVEKPRTKFPTVFPILNVEATAKVIVGGILRNKEFVIIPGTADLTRKLATLLPMKAALLLQRFVDYSMEPNIH